MSAPAVDALGFSRATEVPPKSALAAVGADQLPGLKPASRIQPLWHGWGSALPPAVAYQAPAVCSASAPL